MLQHHAGYWRRLLLALLGPRTARWILVFLARRRIARLSPPPFPPDVSATGDILLILPSNELEVLHHLRNLLELRTRFRQARVTVVCEEASVPLLSAIEDCEIVSVPRSEIRLFSPTLSRLDRRFHGAFDLCCLLAAEEELPLLFLAGRTGAPMRVGYTGGGEKPFLNHLITPPHNRISQSERYRAMARSFGARERKPRGWLVSRQSGEQVDHFLKELRIDASGGLAGFDALFFCRRFGHEWTKGCLAALMPLVSLPWYLYVDRHASSAERQWLSSLSLPLAVNFTIPQTAALIERSRLIVAGNSLFFGLCTLLSTQAVGLFAWHERPFYCPALENLHPVEYGVSPDAETIAAMAQAAVEITSTAPDRGKQISSQTE